MGTHGWDAVPARELVVRGERGRNVARLGRKAAQAAAAVAECAGRGAEERGKHEEGEGDENV
jgi:hypothetical protein